MFLFIQDLQNIWDKMDTTERVMKKAIIQTTILIFSLGLSLLFFSCNTPVNSGKNESTSDDSKQEIPAPIDNGISSRTPPSVNATLTEDFIRGFDASMVSSLEENGVKFYTEKGICFRIDIKASRLRMIHIS